MSGFLITEPFQSKQSCLNAIYATVKIGHEFTGFYYMYFSKTFNCWTQNDIFNV